jgi:hypothetical protein
VAAVAVAAVYIIQVPSKTSRYFSVDFGLTHLVALSLNGYNKVDLCTDKCNKEQIECASAHHLRLFLSLGGAGRSSSLADRRGCRAQG